VETLKNLPVLGAFINLWNARPRLMATVILSAGIIGLLVYEARDVGLTAGNWVALIIASVVVSWLCIWIVSWEDEDEKPAAEQAVVKSSPTEPDETPQEKA
jgi:K+ transporter